LAVKKNLWKHYQHVDFHEDIAENINMLIIYLFFNATGVACTYLLMFTWVPGFLVNVLSFVSTDKNVDNSIVSFENCKQIIHFLQSSLFQLGWSVWKDQSLVSTIVIQIRLDRVTIIIKNHNSIQNTIALFFCLFAFVFGSILVVFLLFLIYLLCLPFICFTAVANSTSMFICSLSLLLI
jgi:hypothetical protein